MLNREIKIPKVLRELHGEKATLSSLILVYLAAFAISAIALTQFIPLMLPLWKLILATVVFLDIGGGVVANLASSTNQYYQQNPKLRLIFLATHVLQPLLLMVVFPQNTAYFVFVLIYTLGSSFFINLIKDRELQQNTAAVLVSIGICQSFLFPLPIPFLYAFAPLFMVKLMFGFSVRRPDFGKMNIS